jgi:hypothetical protein
LAPESGLKKVLPKAYRKKSHLAIDDAWGKFRLGFKFLLKLFPFFSN